jgi:Trk K+ transport system NAD-binding subunit
MANIDEERNYGQGAKGEPAAPTNNRVSAFGRIRFHFDNAIAKSATFIGFLAIGTLIFAIVISCVRYLTEGPLAAGQNWFDRFWDTLSILFLGGGKPDANWGQRILALIFWATNLSFTATIVGFVSSRLNAGVASLKKGRSAIINNNHILILGWSNRVFALLKELATANQSAHKPVVVIFADKDREEMEDELSVRASHLGNLKVITRRGDTTSPEDLQRANVTGAKSIIILDSDESGDATVVSTVLAVKAVNGNPNSVIIAEVDDPYTAEALSVATKGQVRSVRSHEVIARVTAQASRQPGLAAVTLDLLDFAGDEIYFTEVPALVGNTYGQALSAFDKASVIGVHGADGISRLNPSANGVLEAGDQLIVIAEDDHKIVYTGVDDIAVKPALKAGAARKLKPEHLLVIGWSSMGQSVLSELGGFLPKGSTVHIVAQSKYVPAAELADLNFGAIKVTTASTSGDIEELIAAASAKRYDEIIVLGYRNAISAVEADAQTMLIMLQLNQLFAEDGNGVEPTRLVAEILDSRRAELARVAAEGDLVISDNLAALLIAQVSENPALAPVMADLFDPEGSSLMVQNVTDYFAIGTEFTYGQLVAAARELGESAIGYRVRANDGIGSSNGVSLNPSKATKFVAAEGDGVVVIGSLGK